MIKKIKVKHDTFESNILLFKEVKPNRMNVLFGGNGVGKTTLLNGIESGSFDIESSNNFDVISYQNSKNNFRQNEPSPFGDSNGYALDLVRRCTSNEMSEGQSIIYSLLHFFDEIKVKTKKCNGTIVVLLDEIDSGLSNENINFMMHVIINIYHEFDNIQFFISSNSYHFVYIVKNVLSMYDGKYIDINSYEQFYGILVDNMVTLAEKRDLVFLMKN